MIPRDVIEKDFLGEAYQYHNLKRLQHLDSLRLPIEGKSVLEIGAGIGCHTGFFLERDCQIICAEIRDENIAVLKERHPTVEVIKIDFNQFFELPEKVDIVYCYGTLYHLSEPDMALKYMSYNCGEMLLLETCVDFNLKDLSRECVEDSKGPSQSFNGIGCRPSRQWLLEYLQRYFEFVYIPITQPDHPEFPIDWSEKPKTNHLTRAVFVASRKEIVSDLFVTELPMKQRRL